MIDLEEHVCFDDITAEIEHEDDDDEFADVFE
jgi:hypothetical protein